MTNVAKEFGEDAALQAANWLLAAVKHVDEVFGSGYAKSNPALVAAVVQAAALDYHAGFLGRALDAHALETGRS